jgi:hypothetical protein
LVAHRLVLDVLFLVKLDAHGLKVLKLWGSVAVIGFVAYVAYSHIGASNYRHNAEQQIAKCELKGMDTHTMGMKLTLAYCMQAAGYKFEPLDPDCEKLMDTGNLPLVGLVPLRTLVLDDRQQSSRKRQSAKQPGDEAPAISSTMDR